MSIARISKTQTSHTRRKHLSLCKWSFYHQRTISIKCPILKKNQQNFILRMWFRSPRIRTIHDYFPREEQVHFINIFNRNTIKSFTSACATEINNIRSIQVIFSLKNITCNENKFYKRCIKNLLLKCGRMGKTTFLSLFLLSIYIFIVCLNIWSL